MQMLEFGHPDLVKRAHFLWVREKWLLTGYPTENGSFLIDNNKSMLICAVCSCDQCFGDLIGRNFFKKAFEVGVRKMLLKVVHEKYLSWSREDPDRAIEIIHLTEDTLPKNFSILPAMSSWIDREVKWDRGTYQFRNRSEMIRWVISAQCYQSSNLLQIDGLGIIQQICLEPFIGWLEELGRVEESFDPMRFIGRLYTEVLGKPVSEVDIQKMLKEEKKIDS